MCMADTCLVYAMFGSYFIEALVELAHEASKLSGTSTHQHMNAINYHSQEESWLLFEGVRIDNIQVRDQRLCIFQNWP